MCFSNERSDPHNLLDNFKQLSLVGTNQMSTRNNCWKDFPAKCENYFSHSSNNPHLKISNRQRVKLAQDCYSEWGVIPSGVPQGIACVAWRFWLLSNKGGRGQKNREEIGAGATEKPPARTGGFFESVRMPAYGSFRLVQNARLSIKYFGNFPWESF